MFIKITTLSILAASVLFAVAAVPSPLSVGSRSTDNGGAKPAIDAYSDGAGVVVINQASATKLDNSAMNTLVFKYGEEAKLNNAGLKDQVQTISSTSSASDKILANKIGTGEIGFAFSSIPDNVLCNDSNAQTIDDKYTNNVCAGTNVEGQACNDNSAATSGDKYTNGVCAGSAEPLAFNIGTASAGNYFSNNDGYAPYRAIVGSSGSWASQYNTWGTFWQMSYASATVINEIRLKATLVDFDIQGSNNNSTWTNLLSVRGRSELGDVVIKHTFPNTTPYLYYRFSIIKGNGTTPVSYIEEADFRQNQ